MTIPPFSIKTCQFFAITLLFIILIHRSSSSSDETTQKSSEIANARSVEKMNADSSNIQRIYHRLHYQFESPRCIAIDSSSNYLCTSTPREARAAVNFSEGSFVDGRGEPGNVMLGATSSSLMDLGIGQRVAGSDEEQRRILDVIRKMNTYFEEEVLSRPEYHFVRGKCKNHHKLCAFWASVGECETNRGFMVGNCAAACRMCLLKFTNLTG